MICNQKKHAKNCFLYKFRIFTNLNIRFVHNSPVGIVNSNCTLYTLWLLQLYFNLFVIRFKAECPGSLLTLRKHGYSLKIRRFLKKYNMCYKYIFLYASSKIIQPMQCVCCFEVRQSTSWWKV